MTLCSGAKSAAGKFWAEKQENYGTGDIKTQKYYGSRSVWPKLILHDNHEIQQYRINEIKSNETEEKSALAGIVA
jgi:hypothetical protein